MRPIGIPEALWHSFWHYRMIGLEGTLASIQNDIKAQRVYVSCPRTHMAKIRSYISNSQSPKGGKRS